MIEEFEKYGYDYYPSTKGYMAGPQNYVQGKAAYFKYELSKTARTRNNRNNGWTFNTETTHTEYQNRTGYPEQVTNYKYKRELPDGYKQTIYADEWFTELEKLRNLNNKDL
jgi:hypothetical protein